MDIKGGGCKLTRIVSNLYFFYPERHPQIKESRSAVIRIFAAEEKMEKLNEAIRNRGIKDEIGIREAETTREGGHLREKVPRKFAKMGPLKRGKEKKKAKGGQPRGRRTKKTKEGWEPRVFGLKAGVDKCLVDA